MKPTWKTESNKQEAKIGCCLDCGQILERGPLIQWTLRKSFALHERGTGHKHYKIL